jgi:hypothetical protein
VMGPGWKWDRWEDISIAVCIKIPYAIRWDLISKKRNLRIPSTHWERKENEIPFPFEMPWSNLVRQHLLCS